tara:strand:+ start:658 stop:870 length:213 start_codon:yes stop_codon:yes gene_type:complete
MGILKKLLSVFTCSSNCSINNKEIDIESMMSTNMNDYKLKFKDINKIVKILNKRATITKLPKTTISSISL